MNRVMLTGSTGFVGSRLLSILESRGIDVVATSRSLQAEDCQSGRSPGTKIVQLSDASDDKEWLEALKGVDCVVHTAARVHMMRESRREALPLHMAVNTEFTRKISKLARDVGVKRFVFLSTIKVLGERTIGSPFSSYSTANPQDPYSISKHLAEQSLVEVCDGSDMDYVIIRPTLIVGEGAAGNLARLLGWISSRIPLPIANVRNKRSLVSLDTLCRVVELSIGSETVRNMYLIAAEPDALSTGQIVESLARGFGTRPLIFGIPELTLELLSKVPVFGNSVARLTESLEADATETYRLLGWQPSIGLESHLEKLGQNFREYGS